MKTTIKQKREVEVEIKLPYYFKIGSTLFGKVCDHNKTIMVTKDSVNIYAHIPDLENTELSNDAEFRQAHQYFTQHFKNACYPERFSTVSGNEYDWRTIKHDDFQQDLIVNYIRIPEELGYGKVPDVGEAVFIDTIICLAVDITALFNGDYIESLENEILHD